MNYVPLKYRTPRDYKRPKIYTVAEAAEKIYTFEKAHDVKLSIPGMVETMRNMNIQLVENTPMKMLVH